MTCFTQGMSRGASMTAQWSEPAKKRVTGWQHTEWRELANSMGLGREPDRAFEALSPAPIPDDLITTDRMRRDLGDNIRGPRRLGFCGHNHEGVSREILHRSADAI